MVSGTGELALHPGTLSHLQVQRSTPDSSSRLSGGAGGGGGGMCLVITLSSVPPRAEQDPAAWLVGKARSPPEHWPGGGRGSGLTLLRPPILTPPPAF